MSTSNLSADTLFHFTPKYGNLVSILRNGFYSRLCLENIATQEQEAEPDFAVAMVSFCDIPISQVKKHIAQYGCYGIGLSKKWGIKNRICPVLYTYPSSASSRALNRMLKKIYECRDNDFSNYNYIGLDLLTLHFLSKPYEGRPFDEKKQEHKKRVSRFYDEREWRYIPIHEDLQNILRSQISPVIPKRDYDNKSIHERYHKELEAVKLPVEPSSVKYIIIKKREQILRLKDKIEREGSWTPDQKACLMTRIITVEDIRQDF